MGTNKSGVKRSPTSRRRCRLVTLDNMTYSSAGVNADSMWTIVGPVSVTPCALCHVIAYASCRGNVTLMYLYDRCRNVHFVITFCQHDFAII